MHAYDGPALTPASPLSAVQAAAAAQTQREIDLHLNRLDALRGVRLNLRNARDAMLNVMRHDGPWVEGASGGMMQCSAALVHVGRRWAQLCSLVYDLGGTVPADWQE